MRRLYKKLATILSIFLLIIASLSFSGCSILESKGPIKNGYYYDTLNNGVFIFTESSIRQSSGFEISGNNAEYWISGYIDYKAKIVEKDGKIYFEGYMFKELFSKYESGHNTIYEVVYNVEDKSIKLNEVNQS